jgi:hypothetical protein
MSSDNVMSKYDCHRNNNDNKRYKNKAVQFSVTDQKSKYFEEI